MTITAAVKARAPLRIPATSNCWPGAVCISKNLLLQDLAGPFPLECAELRAQFSELLSHIVIDAAPPGQAVCDRISCILRRQAAQKSTDVSSVAVWKSQARVLGVKLEGVACLAIVAVSDLLVERAARIGLVARVAVQFFSVQQ